MSTESSRRGKPGALKLLLGALCILELLPASVHRGAQAQEPCGTSTMGVALLPYMQGGDEVEQAFYQFAGQIPRVDRIYAVEDGQDFFNKLAAVRKLGKQIDFLVVMGHGSKANPSIDFATGPLLPQDVDLAGSRSTLARYEDTVQQGQRAGRDTTAARQKVKEISDQIQFLQSASEAVSDAMARDAEVVLINCSAAATPEGKQFVRNLASVLLSKRGGTVTAATRDVNVTQAGSIANKLAGLYATGQWSPTGDFFVAADWEQFPVHATSAPGTTPGTNAGRFLLQPSEFEVFDDGKKDFVSGRQASTPTSRWRIDENGLTFHSDKDGHQVDASWNQPPSRLAQGDCFKLELKVTVAGPRSLQAEVTPAGPIAEWEIEPWGPAPGVTHPGPNAFLLNVPAGPPNRKIAATMALKVRLAGPPGSINLATGERSGDNRPIRTDELLLELNVNNYGKIHWDYVREGKKRAK